jgi:hypothetical protein
MERWDIEIRIYNILLYIQHPIVSDLEKSLSLFSLKDLFVILDFLESWNLNSIQQLLEDKITEYTLILWKYKHLQSSQKMKGVKQTEIYEKEKDQVLLEEMISFE